jgi:hypothetical protein
MNSIDLDDAWSRLFGTLFRPRDDSLRSSRVLSVPSRYQVWSVSKPLGKGINTCTLMLSFLFSLLFPHIPGLASLILRYLKINGCHRHRHDGGVLQVLTEKLL